MDLSKCQCPNPGFCDVFKMVMGEDPPDWKWCQSSTAQEKQHFYDLRRKVKPQIPIPERSRRFVKISDLYDAAIKLMPYVSRFDGIVGVPRSGMLPASLLSVLLSKPLFSIVDEKLEMLKFMSDFGGTRMNNFQTNKDIKDLSLVFIDDTTHDGTTAKKLKSVFGENISVVSIFSTSFGAEHIEQYSEILEPPHLLEWNFFNSGYTGSTMFDIDGIFCDNIPIDVCEDEERYTKYLQEIIPYSHRIPKLFKASKLVTGRLEKYRGITENWLRRYGFNYDELVMFPTEREAERNANHFQVVGEYKAEIFNSDKQRYFVESEPSEAKVIKSLTSKTVICPNEGVVL